jgi:type VI secretion system secreted protein Hcp
MSDRNANRRLGRVSRPLLAGALAATGASAALPASADVFMFVEGIEGEVTEKSHKDWIEILSYTQAFRNTGSAAGGGGGAGKVTCGDITVLKSIDKSSPGVLQGVVTGKHYQQAKIDFAVAGGKEGSLTYYKVTIDDVQFLAIEQTDQPDEARIVERVTLRGSKFDYEYRVQDPKGGLGDSVKFSVDCKTFKF